MKQDIKCSPMVYMSKHRLQQLQLLRVKGQFCKIPSGFPYLPRFLTFFSHFTSNPTSLLLQLHPFYYSFKHQAEQLRTTLRASIIKHQTPPAPHFELHSAYSAYHQHHRRSLPHTRCPSVSVSVSVLVSLPVSVQIIDQDPIEAAQALCSRSRHPYHLLPFPLSLKRVALFLLPGISIQKSEWKLHPLECEALSRLDEDKRKSVTPSIRLMVKLYIRRKLQNDKILKSFLGSTEQLLPPSVDKLNLRSIGMLEPGRCFGSSTESQENGDSVFRNSFSENN